MDVAQNADMVSFWFYFPTRYASHGIIHVTLKDLILCFYTLLKVRLKFRARKSLVQELSYVKL